MLSGPYGFEEDDLLAPLVGLRGPDVSINVSRAEVAIMRAMVADLSLGEGSYHAAVALRELDIRHGAASSLRPEADTIEVTVPMSSAEAAAIRSVWDALTEHGHLQCRVAGATDLVREMDRRLGAAQAAAADSAATGAVESLGPIAGARPSVVYVDAPPPSTPARLDHNTTPPRLRRAILAAGIVAGAGGCVLGTLFWALILRSWDTDRALVIWIVAALAVFGVGHLASSGLTRYARHLAAEATRKPPRSPINDGGLPVEMWDESEFTR